LVEREARDEVDAEEQGDAEDQDKDRSGPPIRAEPAFPIVQDSTSLRGLAPMRDCLYIACSESRSGRAPPEGTRRQEPFGTPLGRRPRDGLKPHADVPAVDEARPHGDLVVSRLQGGLGTPRRRRERRDPRGVAVLQDLQSSVRDQGRNPGSVAAGLQMTPEKCRLGQAPRDGKEGRERWERGWCE